MVLSHDSLDGNIAADAIRFEVVDDLPAVAADAVKLVSNDAENILYVHPDQLGAPTLMTDDTRSVVWDRVSTPFGEEVSLISSAANDNRSPGQRFEQETGLHYNYFRDYDPTTGRYLQSDPIGLAGGINTYGYVHGNPVNYTDPDGLFPCAGACTVPAVVATARGGYALYKLYRTYRALQLLNELYNEDVCIVTPMTDLPWTNPNENNDGDAEKERKKNRDKGIPDRDLGPSGEPKIKGKKHATKKRAKEAARNEGGGAPEHHPSPKKGLPHYHPVDNNGSKQRPHHYYPKK